MIGRSSDGDIRLLGAMNVRMKFGLTPDTDLKLFAENIRICVQDTVHAGTKMRNRLLNTSIVLYMGNEIVSNIHIKMLLDQSPKAVHGLVHSDISPDDRQNYGSVEKIMETRVLDALEKCVVGSKGTIMYLKTCKQITSSYLDKNLDPIERIYRLWHALYFLRCWRRWIRSPENDHTITNNFITTNLYTCVEINAHALVYLVLKLRDGQRSDMFLPELCGSQPCEHIFRYMRSMGTANYTKINFTLSELLHLVARVELMNKVVYSHDEIEFPRVRAKSKTASNVNLPDDQDILMAMEKARKAAIENAAEFDMNFKEDDITAFDASILSEVVKKHQFESSDLIPSTSGNIPEENDILDQEASGERPEITKFVEVIDSDGTVRNVRKSTFVWMLSESKGKLSSDRLKRVQGSSSDSEPKRKKPKSNYNVPYEGQILFKFNDLEIGNWGMFEVSSSEDGCEDEDSDQLLKKFLFGVILGFKTIGEKGQPKQYKWSHAPTPISKSFKTNVQVLGDWYTCNQSGELTPVPNKKKRSIHMNSYIATMKAPVTTKHENPSSLTYKIPCEYSEMSNSLVKLLEDTAK